MRLWEIPTPIMMMKHLARIVFPGLIWTSFGIAFVQVASGCTSAGVRSHIVVFAFPKFPSDTLRVAVTDSNTVTAARRYIETGKGPHIPTGIIVHGAGVDTRYPFHYLPETVSLAEMTMELCDGAPMHTAAEVSRFIAGAGGTDGKARWCPWGAYPIRVE